MASEKLGNFSPLSNYMYGLMQAKAKAEASMGNLDVAGKSELKNRLQIMQTEINIVAEANAESVVGQIDPWKRMNDIYKSLQR